MWASCDHWSGEFLAEGCLYGIGFLVILEDEGVGGCVEVLESRAGFHRWFLELLEHDLGVIVGEILELGVVALGHWRVFGVHYFLYELIVGSYGFVDAHDTFLAAHGVDLLHGCGYKLGADLGELGIEEGVHLAGGVAVVDTHSAHGHEARREVLGCGDAALHRVGYDVEVIGCRGVVFGKHACVDSPFAEILAHHGLECPAA